ncbi:MAG: crossover junction endodeoxyribonuclease RuvC [Planctomycetota bacterium]
MLPDHFVPDDVPYDIVLGIDPGTVVLGWGAVLAVPRAPRLLACGVLTAPARASVPARLASLARQLEDLLDAVRPGIVAVETAFAAINVKSALRIGEARGVVLAAAGRRALAVDEIAPAAAKRAVLGNGRASKEQVAALVPQLLGLAPGLAVPLDATDALALALAHLRRREAPGGSTLARSARVSSNGGPAPRSTPA